MGHGEIVSTSSPERPVPVATDGIRVLLPPPRKEDKGASGAGGNDAESPPAVVSSRSPMATLVVGLPPAAMIPRPILNSMLGLGFHGRGRQHQHGTPAVSRGTGGPRRSAARHHLWDGRASQLNLGST